MQQSNEGNSVELELCEVNQSEEDGDNLDASDGSNIDLLYGQLERAFLEAEKFKQEAYEESRRRGEAEKQANKALYRAQALQNLYAKELRCRKETEEALAKEKEEHQKTKNEREQERLITMDQKLMWGIQASGSNSKIEELKDERLSAVEQCEEYKKERDKLLEERDNVLRLAQEISDQMLKEEEGSCSNTHSSLVAFSFAEIEDATCSFDPLLRIGEIRHGKIYKGVLHHTPVAIKVLNRHSTLGFEAFRYEVDMMSKLRHPNIAILIGACEKECTLIYEYLANGNLEDRLKCKDNTPPLPWQTRINIATEICLVLTFLHSFTPHGIVHGDLTSTNILLDSNFSCKLSGFRTCRSPSHGDIVLDPHFLALATGEVSPKLDTYSFGIILLQLLTGLSSINGQMEIIDAIDEGSPSSLSLDTKAGDWPAVQAEQLIHLAFRCCSSDLTIRPDLESDVWRALEAMRASSSETDEFGSRDDEQAPSYFVCPILQEVMEDPHVAADGYTYEAEALRGWLASGHNTSPMTNLELQHLNLIPNYSLRSAIIEWKERQ